MLKFLAYIPDGELFDAKCALLQFAGVASDERHLVVIDSVAEVADVRAALDKTGKDYLLIELGPASIVSCKGDADLRSTAEALASAE
ncbi:hypothetical protein [Rhizobium grahamii]|uniref:Uncharacterized protein n=1 Tax=Rhizobium grahamii TaxID=1120045 RepID=A0A370KTF2_9HYPH|nr:hypothetical protein [Rhizobium grahamii]RDJ13923.1 hypothetical protein B5K06_08105 [Rhizobium grahamii]